MVDVIKTEEEKFDLVKAYEHISTGLSTMTPTKLAKMAERMVEIVRANKTLGRSNTQTTNQLMTLTMLTDAPYRRLRQCLAQIEDRRKAIESSYFRIRKEDVHIKKWRRQADEGDELAQIRFDEAVYNQERTKIYLDGAFKELAVFQEAYEEIRINNGIPENWDEMDAERDEIKHHIRQAFRQAHRDMILNGRISQGNAEYMEQYGIHLQVAQKIIGNYIAHCEDLIEDGQMPRVTHLYAFLDDMVEQFGDAHQDVVNHIGLDKLIRGDFLYREDKHGNT